MDAYRYSPMPRRLAVALIGALLALTACSSSDDAGTMAATTTAAATSASFNDADVAFVTGMIPHHEQALTIASLADEAKAGPAVRRLAAEIEAAQDPEIATMRGWLQTWSRPTPMPMDHGDMPGMGDADGMASAADLTRLRALTGATFDRLFLQLMRAHHLGAIEMAQVEQRDGADPRVKALAQQIETAQAAEVKRIEQLLAS